MSTTQRQTLDAENARPITCKGTPDCTAKWTRAGEWVRDNSPYPIVATSAMVIETASPSPVSRQSGVTVILANDGFGVYSLEFSSACGLLVPCEPSSRTLRAAFASYVMNGPSSPVQ